MKEETKELVKFIKQQMDCVKEEAIKQNAQSAWWFCTYDKAITFLDSLPEIESHLCRGGYIQDKNGTPCCDGYTVIFNEIYGKLIWDNRLCKFKIEYHETGTSFLFYSEIDRTKIEKVEK